MTASVEAVVAAIRDGRVVAIPTDTVYGLACDPSNTEAVGRIYDIKRRPAGLELTLLAPDLDAIDRVVDLNELARRLAERYWPGPLSIVAILKRRDYAIPTFGSTLSTRIPDHALLLDLLRRTGPLATTSANRHGEAPATTAADVEALLPELDTVLDGGPGDGKPSSIIDCSRIPPRVLRQGPISETELLELAGASTRRRRLEQAE